VPTIRFDPHAWNTKPRARSASPRPLAATAPFIVTSSMRAPAPVALSSLMPRVPLAPRPPAARAITLAPPTMPVADAPVAEPGGIIRGPRKAPGGRFRPLLGG
jgi:hypothetical protein